MEIANTTENEESSTYQPLQAKNQWVRESSTLTADDAIPIARCNDDDDDILMLHSTFYQSQDEKENQSQEMSSFGKETIKTTDLTLFNEDEESDNENEYYYYGNDENEIVRNIPILSLSHSQIKRLDNEMDSIFCKKAHSLVESSEDEEDNLLVLKRANPIDDDDDICVEDNDDD